MGDPLSTLASIVAVLQLSKAVVGYIKDVKGGRGERIRLLDCILGSEALLEMLRCRFEVVDEGYEGFEVEIDDTAVSGVGVQKEKTSRPETGDERESNAATLADGLTTSNSSKLPKSIFVPSADVEGPLRELKALLENVIVRLKLRDSGMGRVIQRVSWPFDREDVRGVVEGIERVKSFFGLVMQEENLRLTQAVKNDVSELGRDMAMMRIETETRNRNQEEEAIIEWLSSTSPWKKQLDIESEREPGTGQWLFKEPLLQDWLNGRRRKLWCPGIPGAGKTVVACTIINYLVARHTFKDDSAAVVFLYCSYKQQQEQDAFCLLASILRQLVEQLPAITKTVKCCYQEHRRKGTLPKIPESIKVFESVISEFKTVYLVIDALDECTEDSRRILMETLNELPPSFQILCTSRELSDIEQMFPEGGKVQIHATEGDVEKYLLGKMASSPRLAKHIQADPSLIDAIKTAILARVDGMFLLAHLHIETLLKKKDRKAVRRALERLPTTVDATYKQALERIDGQEKEDAELGRRILSWVSCSRRPLKPLELRIALAIEDLESEEDTLDEEGLSDEETLLDVCAGLITIDQKSSVVRLVHFTAQEYFQNSRETTFPDGEKFITKACLRYLSLDLFQDVESPNFVLRKSRRLRGWKHGFLDYALGYVMWEIE